MGGSRSQQTVIRLAIAGLLAAGLVPTASAQFVRVVDPFSVADTTHRFEQPFFGGFDRPIPQLVDIDGDNDLDLFVQEDDETLRYFENTGDAFQHNFQWRSDRFADLTGEWFHFADLDSDLDFDLLVGTNFDEIAYFENTGSTVTPVFDSTPLIVRDVRGNKLLSDPPMVPAILDVDCNGSLDLFLGQQLGTIKQFELVPSAGSGPSFELVTERFQDIEVLPAAGVLNKSERHGANAQAFLDVDLDGDIDLYYGDFFERSLLYFRNDGTCADISMHRVADSLLVGPGEYFLTTGYNVPTTADLNGDGQKDLIVGTLNHNVPSLVDNLFFLTNGGGTFTLEESRLIHGLDFGTKSIPAFGDVDRDGDQDLVIGSSLRSNSRAGLALLRQTGENAAPAFDLVDLDFLELDVGLNYSPAFADVDGDGDDDLFVGTFNGGVAFLRAVNAPPFYILESVDFAEIDALGTNTTPAFADVDADGDLDLLVGESTGTLNLFENTGTLTTPVFETHIANFAGIDVGSLSRVQLHDWDGDGDLDAILGGGFRGLMVAINTGSSTSFELSQPIALELDAGSMSAAAFIDIDFDGDSDLISGDESGGLRFFRNLLVDTSTESRSSREVGLIQAIYPNPITDGSFTLDLKVGVGSSRVTIVKVYDILGRELLRRDVLGTTQTVRIKIPGYVSSGVLLVRVATPLQVDHRTVVLAD